MSDLKSLSDADLKAHFSAEHGEVHILKIAGLRACVRLPKDEEYDRWKDDCEKEKGRKPIGATEKIFRQCCLYPELSDIKRGFYVTLGNSVLELYGVHDSDKVEKA